MDYEYHLSQNLAIKLPKLICKNNKFGYKKATITKVIYLL
jgi:hypothetical protein